MNTRKWIFGGLVCVAAVAIMGFTPLTDRELVMKPQAELSSFLVSVDDYRGMAQERLGYAVALGHYVARAHADGMLAAVGQERLGYQVATHHLIDVRQGLDQTLLGYGFALEQAQARTHALMQEQLGMRYMLGMGVEPG